MLNNLLQLLVHVGIKDKLLLIHHHAVVLIQGQIVPGHGLVHQAAVVLQPNNVRDKSEQIQPHLLSTEAEQRLDNLRHDLYWHLPIPIPVMQAEHPA